MLEEEREKQLVEKARKGDRAALEGLFAGARERVLGTIRARLGPAVRHVVDPEDVLQDTFTRALGSAERFEWQGQGSFGRWLESIATHIVLDAARRQGHRRVLQIEGDLRGDAASPSKHLQRKERLERLRRSLGALSPEHQSVLRLSRMEGLSIKEIAERLGRSESAVKNLLLRATRQLRTVFGDTESLSLESPQLGETGEANGR